MKEPKDKMAIATVDIDGSNVARIGASVVGFKVEGCNEILTELVGEKLLSPSIVIDPQLARKLSVQ